MKFLFTVCAFALLMPVQDIQLTERKILKGQISILVPEDFGIMTLEALKVKYPKDNRPDLVFTNDSSTVNLHFEHTDFEATPEQIPLYLDQFLRFFEQNYPASPPLDKGTGQINGHEVGYIEIKLPADGDEVYNLMFYTTVNERLMIISFNCTAGLMEKWKETAFTIMRSLKVYK